MGKKTTCAARFLFYTEVQPVLLLFSRPRELKSEVSADVFLAAVALSMTFVPDFFLRKMHTRRPYAGATYCLLPPNYRLLPPNHCLPPPNHRLLPPNKTQAAVKS